MADFQAAVAAISALKATILKLEEEASKPNVNTDAQAAVLHQLAFLDHVQKRAELLSDNVAKGKNRNGIGNCGDAPCDLLYLAAQDFRSDFLNKNLSDDQKAQTGQMAEDIQHVANSAVKLVKRLKAP